MLVGDLFRGVLVDAVVVTADQRLVVSEPELLLPLVALPLTASQCSPAPCMCWRMSRNSGSRRLEAIAA